MLSELMIAWTSEMNRKASQERKRKEMALQKKWPQGVKGEKRLRAVLGHCVCKEKVDFEILFG